MPQKLTAVDCTNDLMLFTNTRYLCCIINIIDNLFITCKSDFSDKMWFLLNCGFVSTYLWILIKTCGEKATWELHKNVTCCFKQILTEKKNISSRPLTSHLTNYPNKMNMTCCAREGQTHKWHSLMDSYTWTQCSPTRKDLYQICMDTGCSLEGLLGVVNDRNDDESVRTPCYQW